MVLVAFEMDSEVTAEELVNMDPIEREQMILNHILIKLEKKIRELPEAK